MSQKLHRHVLRTKIIQKGYKANGASHRGESNLPDNLSYQGLQNYSGRAYEMNKLLPTEMEVLLW